MTKRKPPSRWHGTGGKEKDIDLIISEREEKSMKFEVVGEITFGEYGMVHVNGTEIGDLIKAITGKKEGEYKIKIEKTGESE